MIDNKNFSGSRLPLFVPTSGEVVEDCNFAQPQPHTLIAPGVAGLSFRGCNLVNCTPPSDAIVIDCNTAQISRCGHLHDDVSCGLDCEHLVATEDIIVDGVVVDTLREYRDKVL